MSLTLKLSTGQVALIMILSGLYATLTVALGSFGYSWIQVRISESLAPLPFLFGSSAAIGITLGVLIANLFSPVGLPDLVFGTMLSFLAALLSWKASLGKRTLACTYPIVINALGVSLYLSGFYGIDYLLAVASIGLGQTISCFLVGYPLLLVLEKANLQRRFNATRNDNQKQKRTQRG